MKKRMKLGGARPYGLALYYFQNITFLFTIEVE